MGKRKSKKRKNKLARPPRRKSVSAESKLEIPELPPEFYQRSEDSKEVEFARSQAEEPNSDDEQSHSQSAAFSGGFSYAAAADLREPDELDPPIVEWSVPFDERPFGAIDRPTYYSRSYQKFHANVVAIRASLPKSVETFATYDLEDIKQRRWLARYSIKKETGEIYRWQQYMLEKAGFNWVRGRKPSVKVEKKPSASAIAREAKWMQSYEALRDLCSTASDGTMAIVALLHADDVHYDWLRQQLLSIRADKLKAKYRELLDALPLDLAAMLADRGFTKWRSHFRAYVAGELKNAERWAAKQCLAKRDGTILPWRMQALDAIDFDWSREISPAYAGGKVSKQLQLEKMENRWRKKLDDYLALEAVHGKPLSMQLEEARPLRPWLSRIRENYNKGKLRPELIAEFEAKGFVFSGAGYRQKLLDQKWNQQFKKLEQFKERFGHVLVPSTYRDDPELGTWVARQRERLTRGKLKGEKRARFEAIGVKPSQNRDERERIKVHISAWLKTFREIEAFLKAEHGGRLPRVVDLSDKHRNWLKRQCHKIHVGDLDSWQLEKLDAIGFDPKSFPEPLTKVQRLLGQQADWRDRLERLRRFVAEHGHGNVSRSCPDKKLYNFVQRVRMRKRQGTITQEELTALNELGFSFEPSREITPAWMRVYKVLEVYYQEHGNCQVPRQYPSDQALAEFVAQQKQRGRKGLLLAEHIRLLNELNFEWVDGVQPKPKDQ
jgi:hypothetical protein